MSPKRRVKIVQLSPHYLKIHPNTRIPKVKSFIEAIQRGAEFPPVLAYRRHYDDLWTVTDGAHRVAAHRFLNTFVLVKTYSTLYFPDEVEIKWTMKSDNETFPF